MLHIIILKRYISNTKNLKDINIYNNTIYSRFIINNNGNKVLGLPFLQKYYSVVILKIKK